MKRLYSLLLLLACATLVHAREGILLFESDIVVRSDGSMQVTETIVVNSEGRAIRRGIQREFPTRYRDRYGNRHSVGFTVRSVTLNGHPTPFSIQNHRNGKLVRIGRKQVFLAPGRHRFQITYTTNRQIGFFDSFDELYWNVTGTGWRLPIDQAVAHVTLPAAPDFDAQNIIKSFEAYTGRQGTRGQHYRAEQAGPRTISFFTTMPLGVFEGLTVVVAFRKGVVHEPTAWQRMLYFLHDNWFFLITILGFLLLLCWFLYERWRVGRMRKNRTIIPQFYPPDNCSPGQMRYVVERGYDATVLTSELVDMAVHGVITIQHEKTSGVYSLHKGTKEHVAYEQEARFDFQQHLFLMLLAGEKSCMLTSRNSSTIHRATKFLSDHLSTLCKPLFSGNTRYGLMMFGAGLLFITTLFGSGIFGMDTLRPLSFFGMFVLLYLMVRAGKRIAHVYSEQGHALLDHIEGFKMFLQTTEQERLKIIGSPPTKNPELYEKYLPYAIALGVEKQWTAQFKPIFDRLTAEGRSYEPTWYIGPSFYHYLNARALATGMTNSLHSAIPASTYTPGTFSGSGGGGYSGGGGGGGGGGGW